MSKKLAGRVAVITGGRRGLGRAMAVALAEQGAQIALVGRDQAALDESVRLVEAAGSTASVHTADVSNETDVARLGEEIAAKYGKVQLLINNAGVNLRKNLDEFTLAEWKYVQEANVNSVFLVSRAMIPLMRGQGYGRILMMTSIMSHVSLAGRTAYSTSKTALLGMIRALALELAPEGITVNGISPGPFATEMNTPLMNDPEKNAQFLAKLPVGRWGDPAEVGALAAFLCGPDAGFITGTDILIDGGWTAS
ncbi:MAG: SDR family oxidoreductase [Acidobacteria bacterium]|nr:SDR family oxidoreductase [Acidobacteriota bacterium]